MEEVSQHNIDPISFGADLCEGFSLTFFVCFFFFTFVLITQGIIHTWINVDLEYNLKWLNGNIGPRRRYELHWVPFYFSMFLVTSKNCLYSSNTFTSKYIILYGYMVKPTTTKSIKMSSALHWNAYLLRFCSRGRETSRHCPGPLHSPRWWGQTQSGCPSSLSGSFHPSSLARLELLRSTTKTKTGRWLQVTEQ